MEAVASGLAAGSGLDKPGARVGVYGANCREWMVAMQARAAPCARPLQQRPAAAAQSVCSRAGAARTAAPGAHHSAEARCNHLKRPARRAAAASVRDAHAWP